MVKPFALAAVLLLALATVDPIARAATAPTGSYWVAALEYRGGSSASTSGGYDAPCKEMTSGRGDVSSTESTSWSWSAEVVFYPRLAPQDGTYSGAGSGEIRGRVATEDRSSEEARSGPGCTTLDKRGDSERKCLAEIDRPASVGGEARAVDGAMRVEFRLPSPPGVLHCDGESVGWTKEDGERTHSLRSSTMRNFAAHAFVENVQDPNTVIFTLPFEGRASYSPSFRAPLPAKPGDPALILCMTVPDTRMKESGECTASGTLTVRTFFDPCPGLAKRYLDFYAAVDAIDPPPADAPEAWVVQAWGDDARAKVAALLAAARQLLMQCGEASLPLDPAGIVEEVYRMYRDALAALAKRGKLSERGAAEMVAAERVLQLLGSAENPSDFEFPPGLGTLDVSVASPVALHAYDARGRHVGWNATKNASEVGIPGARYEGAPRGAQRIVLPHGFYQIVVEELAEGTYVLDVFPNATGAGHGEAFAAKSKPGRFTSVHYALDSSGANATLQGYLPRRAATPPASFFDSGFAAAGAAAQGPPPLEEASIPGLEAAAALLAVAGAALVAARRRA